MRNLLATAITGLLFCLSAPHVNAAPPNTFGGCCDPCVNSHCGACIPCKALDPGPIQAMKIVMVPKYVTEARAVCVTEYKKETRQRTYTVYKTVPVEEERIATVVEWVPKTETKTVEYTVTVPVRRDEDLQLAKTVPVWKDEVEEYTVKVPVLQEVDEQYTVKVPKLKDVDFTYTVQVPKPVTRTIERTFTNIIPVTKIRTLIESTEPETKTRMVSKDVGQWENRYVEVPCFGGGTLRVVKRFWVPKIVNQEESYLVSAEKTQDIKYTAFEQRSTKVPYECTHICFSPEERTATKKQVVYETETRTRPRKVAVYRDEVRTRTKKVLSFTEQLTSTTFPVIDYQKETKTKEVTYTVKVPKTTYKRYTVTRYDRVPEEKIETYIVNVPVSVIKNVDVQVCQMIPKVVTVYIDPCINCCNGNNVAH